MLTERGPDGAVAQTVFNRDGSAIRSTLSAPGSNAGWDERHTVRLPDGSLTTFENSGLTQTIYDGNARPVSAAVMTAAGPEPQAILQPAALPFAPFVPSAVANARAALMLFGLLSRRNGPDGTAVLAIRAGEYQGDRALHLPRAVVWVGRLTQKEVGQVCPRLGKVQSITDNAAETVNPSDYSSPATYGTAVHMEVRQEIRSLKDPNLRAEVSLLKTLQETGELPPGKDRDSQETDYGEAGSIRVDVLENTRKRTVCVYDIKTGVSGLSPARSAEIASTAFLRYPTARRIIVIEVRPRR